MKKSWNSFWNDYKKCWNDGMKFYKKHWKGTIVFCIVTYVVSYGIGFAIGKAAICNKQKDYNFDLSEFMNEPVNDVRKEEEE